MSSGQADDICVLRSARKLSPESRSLCQTKTSHGSESVRNTLRPTLLRPLKPAFGWLSWYIRMLAEPLVPCRPQGGRFVC